jgi:hypothetical protein
MARSKYHLKTKRGKGKFVFYRKKNHEVKEVLKASA